MSVSIIVGGQFGSEGKGKVSKYWAQKVNASAVVRVGGPNSGHTVYDQIGNLVPLRMLPASAVLTGNYVTSVLAAGTYINLPVLLEEIERTKMPHELLKIDPNAVIINEQCGTIEKNLFFRETIGSTLSGTGSAVANRVMRCNNMTLAKELPELQKYIIDTKKYIRNIIDKGGNVVIEGTQGYGLSNYHTKYYPYATARDTTAAGFLSETGLSPFDVEYIVMVLRTFPIRVAGNSGPLPNEITWEEVSEQSGSESYFEEKTTVTHKVRRVARFDPEVVREAIIANKPNVIVLNHVDYIDMENSGNHRLSQKQYDFISDIEKQIGQNIEFVGNGANVIFRHRADGAII